MILRNGSLAAYPLDFNIPMLLISTYLRKGFLGKVEALMDKAIAKKKLNFQLIYGIVWQLASLYLENN